MKKAVYTLILGVFISIGCGGKQQRDGNVEVLFKSTKVYQDGLFNYNGNSDAGKHIVYIYTADVQNNSKFLFNEVDIRYSIEIELENGNIINEEQISGILKMFNFKSFKHWKPGEVKKVQDIHLLIPIKYVDYPIAKITVILNYQCYDEINNSSTNYPIYKDITELWKVAAVRVQNNEWDMDTRYNWDQLGLQAHLNQH